MTLRPELNTGITNTQSYSAVVRDVLFAKCVQLPFFEGFTARRTKQFPTQPYHLPYLGVYIIDENITPDGDWNAGYVGFIHDLKLGITVQIEDNDPLQLELALDAAFWAIMNGLWADQYVMNLLDTWNPHSASGHPDNTRVEGVPRGHRRHNWGNPRPNNETPWAELQYEPVIRYRTIFSPEITDTLDRIAVETTPLQHPNRVAPADELQRIISIYEFRPPETEPEPAPQPVD